MASFNHELPLVVLLYLTLCFGMYNLFYLIYKVDISYKNNYFA